jgi:hypothetical protein
MRARSIITVSILLLFIAATTARAEVRFKQRGKVSFYIVENEPWHPEGFDEPTILQVPLVERAPTIDGQVDDEAWSRAEEIKVPLAYGPVKEATLKAVYTEKEVFLLVSWPDPTKDDLHHPWVWDAEQGRYVEGPQVEDQLLVSFEAGCDWTPSLLSGYTYDLDSWRWLAARTNPLGQAIDTNGHTRKNSRAHHVKYKVRGTKPTWQLKFDGHGPGFLTKPWQELTRWYRLEPIPSEVWIRNDADDGFNPPPFVKRRQAPTMNAEPQHALPAPGPRPAYAAPAPPPVVPQYEPVKLTGDAGEVAAHGRWVDGRWTVEFRRALVTPSRYGTDMVFDRVAQFSLYVFDHTERVDEASESGRLWLRFLPADQP